MIVIFKMKTGVTLLTKKHTIMPYHGRSELLARNVIF